MARVFLKDEILSVIQATIEKLQRAKDVFETTERNVADGILAHLDTDDLNAAGIEGYESGGVLIADAIALITALGADASAGLYFPRIAAIGSPKGFEQFQVDVVSVSGTDRAVLIAESKSDATLFPNPWGQLVNGEQVVIQRINANIGAGAVLNDKKLQDVVIEVRDKDTDSSKHRLIFETTFTFFGADAESPTTTSAATAGNKGGTLVLRQVTQP